MNLIYSRSPPSDAFEQSKCQHYENNFTNYLVDLIKSQGYTAEKLFPGDDLRNDRIFKKGQRRVFVSLVDDLIYLDPERGDPLSWMVHPNDIIITDNYLLRPTVAKILRLPPSWFGIYLHQTPEILSSPTKDFSLQINRLDPDRFHMILEMRRQGLLLEQGHVNVNCVSDVLQQTHSTESAQDHCRKCWDRILPHIQDKYRKEANDIINIMPYNNHDMPFETALHSGMLHVCVETYPSSTWSISLSEKTFRALLTPRPFMLYSASHSLEYLTQLGFDTMGDLVPHDRYDVKTSHNTDLKMSVFINLVKDTISDLKSRDWNQIRDRCLAAVSHNHALLSKMRRDWAGESGEFIVKVSQELRNG